VLLVDEPAEHLDPTTADALLTELLADGATIVVVTHRLAGLAAVDEILVLDGGTVAARGSHDELVSGHPPYREAWLAQQPLGVESVAQPAALAGPL
jgi:ATP-binding cassette subfamily C protein CydC